MMRIIFSNLGYATGINGSLRQHAGKVLRHAFQTKTMQSVILSQFRAIMDQTDPDLCCLVELDQGSIHSGYFNQITALTSSRYPIFDIADKYGPSSHAAKLPFHRGKSNGFLAKKAQTFERLYFEHGTKRLIYKITLKPGLTLFFAHFSLKQQTRVRQFREMRAMADQTVGEVIVFGDFNTLSGLAELKPLLNDSGQDDSGLHLLNKPELPTFRFHRWQHTLDLCLCSPSLAASSRLTVIDQPFSDHAALLLEIG